MQVMNVDEFSQTEVLIGQIEKTQSFGVSDDPMLMSMLSTGFYANPHRTMIQEIMFNAWDAHKEAGCTDKAIDIYINPTSGLMIRDYGFGIPAEDMHQRYCMYGFSDKRESKIQTGGFGLGCKSPFAYTESFTVTSNNRGQRNMYLISRVADDAGGKPGMTKLLTCVTTESGLLVTIPLKKFDIMKTSEYIHDILYLSGIKACLHFDDAGELPDGKLPLLVESVSLAPGEYSMDQAQKQHHSPKIFAVYGGVRYEILDHDDYKEEMKFLKAICKTSNLFIGFAPDSLTPLPSREGLNMSDHTREKIKQGLELSMERFQLVFNPLVKIYFQELFKNYKKVEIQAHFALFHSLSIGIRLNNYYFDGFQKSLEDRIPPDIDERTWRIGIELISQHTSIILNVITKSHWLKILVMNFCKVYPDQKNLGFALLKVDVETVICSQYHDNTEVENIIAELLMAPFATRHFEFEQAMKKEFPDLTTLHPRMRLNHLKDGKWLLTTRDRTRCNFSKTEEKPRKYQINKTHSFDNPARIWTIKNGHSINQMFLTNHILLAKTAASLGDTVLPIRKYFSTDKQLPKNYVSNGIYSTNETFGIIPAYVVHTRNGAYDKAKTMLEDRGFIVIEAREPDESTRGATYVPVVKSSPEFWKIQINSAGWINEEETAYIVEKPTHFLYLTKMQIRNNSFGSYSRGERPEEDWVRQMMIMHPDMVMIHSTTKAEIVEKKGMIPFHIAVANWFNSLIKDKILIRNVVRARRIHRETNIRQHMLLHTGIQKALGMTPVEDLGGFEDRDFWREVGLLESLLDNSFLATKDIRKEANDVVHKIWNSDPKQTIIARNISKTLVFSERKLSPFFHALSDSKKDKYALTFAQYLRAV